MLCAVHDCLLYTFAVSIFILRPFCHPPPKQARLLVKQAPTLKGSVEGKDTSNAIYSIKMVAERAVEIKTDLCMCSVNYCKAFRKVRHNQLMEMLENVGKDGEDLRVNKNIYW